MKKKKFWTPPRSDTAQKEQEKFRLLSPRTTDSESTTERNDLRFGEADFEVVIAFAGTDLPPPITTVSITAQASGILVLHKLNEQRPLPFSNLSDTSGFNLTFKTYFSISSSGESD